MLSTEIRKRFLDYFEKRGHTIVPSCPLIPPGDPTLLFTNAGMVQFKRVFLGEEKRSYKRAASCQKCVRAGGKHNDLENVGHTIRHHTFFEMLGNFSFGDYFKEEAIAYAWELVTKEFGLSKERLWITVFKNDDEAYQIWHKKIGIPTERIVRLSEKDNFWSMGETGPCGPCSEIIYDLGKNFSCGQPQCAVGCDCDRWLELWNLVFMQYNKDSEGRLTSLPNPCVDTGMGLERMAMVIQGVNSNYETDLFKPIIDALCNMTEISYGKDGKKDISFRVIADHSRAISFIMADGILPSNEGRGYVLRRILRRAVRHGHVLGLKKPFLYTLTDIVKDMMGDIYPEIKEAHPLIKEITQKEEERFLETLDFGLKLLSQEIEKIRQKTVHILPGETAFKLYDTYGFPIDIITDMAREEGVEVDIAGFEKAMALQKSRAREAQKAGTGILTGIDIYTEFTYRGEKTVFVGYETLETRSKITHLIKKGKELKSIRVGEECELITEKTPFYGESGGQIGDTGIITSGQGEAEVKDTQRAGNIFVHLVKIKKGKFSVSDEVLLKVDEKRRSAIACNHTATHLLQAALRNILGTHIKQAGSLVAPERLRFDFTHFAHIDPEILEKIELWVNRSIRKNLPVETQEMPLIQAIKSGAIAIFEEKYADMVRVVSIAGLSKELCGGTHVKRSGDIGYFKILSESSVAAGVRRIEAVTGEAAVKYVQEKERLWQNLASLLKAKPKDILLKIEHLLQQNKQMEKEITVLKSRLVSRQSEEILKGVKKINGISVLATEVPNTDMETLRQMGDKLRDKLKSGVIVLGTRTDSKALLLAIVTQDLTPKIQANEIIKNIVHFIDGGGGGKPEMAQAGGKKPKRLEQALEGVYKIIANLQN